MTYTNLSDLELISLIKKDDLTAYDELYHRYWQSLYYSTYSILKDREECMDLLQDVFLWLWEKRSDLRIMYVKAFLFAIVKYKVANYIRSGKVRESFFNEIKKSPDFSVSPEAEYEEKELQNIINMCTNELPEKCREIFLLRKEAYFTNKEVALKLSISEKTVENQITIAVRKLRFSLQKITIFSIFVLLSRLF